MFHFTCPFSSIFGWYIDVTNVILGGLKGYSAGKFISILNAPLLYGASSCNSKNKISNWSHTKFRLQRTPDYNKQIIWYRMYFQLHRIDSEATGMIVEIIHWVPVTSKTSMHLQYDAYIFCCSGNLVAGCVHPPEADLMYFAH